MACQLPPEIQRLLDRIRPYIAKDCDEFTDVELASLKVLEQLGLVQF